MCGLGDSVSRRMLDPPLILQLAFTGSILSPLQMTNLASRLICHVSLAGPDPAANQSHLILSNADPSQIQESARPENLVKTLLGQTAVNAMILEDVADGNKRMFFVFPDLAIRIQGEYRLVCHVADMTG